MTKMFSIAFIGVVSFFGITSSVAGAAEYNFGACMANAQDGAQKLNAPGQSGFGPLTVVGTEFVWPDHAFDGAVGCSR